MRSFLRVAVVAFLLAGPQPAGAQAPGPIVAVGGGGTTDAIVSRTLEEASRELTEAVRLDPGDADALAHLAYCDIKLGRLSDARNMSARPSRSIRITRWRVSSRLTWRGSLRR